MLKHQAQPGEAATMHAPLAEPVSARLRTFQVAEGERRGNNRPRRRRWRWLAVLAALAAVGWGVGQQLMPEHATAWDTYTFTGEAPRDVLLDLSGSVVPRTRIAISTQVGGILARVHLPAEGQQVEAGALLFEIDDSRYRAEYLQAEAALATAAAQLSELENGTREEEKEQAAASLEQAKAHLSLMIRECERFRKLHSKNAVTVAELDKSEKALVEARLKVRSEQANFDLVHKGPRDEKIAAARAEVQRAQANRDRAEYDFGRTKIYAPADGMATSYTLLERNVDAGESIQPYTALCSLADLTDMEAEVDVQERDLGALVIGGPCEVIPDAYPDRVYRGKVNRKQPIVNRQRGVVQVKVTIDQPDEYLLPDMNVRVMLLNRPTHENLPEVPLRALVPDRGAPVVFVLDAQAARLRHIETGATVGDRVQVRDGLRPGDRVILPGEQALQDGQPVQVQEVTPADRDKEERS